METLLKKIRGCTLCKEYLPLGPRPVVMAHPDASIAIIGQAPGTKVHQSGIPWDDASGKRLREWLDISVEVFYDPTRISIVPMGFCYPGKGKSGDMPPRPECAPKWHQPLFSRMPKLKLVLLVGMYAQQYYLETSRTLTETVKNYQHYLPEYFPLPHPSPRNRLWLLRNPWFEASVVPELQQIMKDILRE